ncbi:MAG: c-type cytochrome [Pseudomonadales bacterium]|jgi:cytochrome c oxidase subunit 2|nr:c-type cytochrome [Pseudomonadales bacterium]
MRSLLPVALLIASVAAQGESADRADPAERYSYCITCHGTEGRGNLGVEAPRIGGMEDWYITRQLTGFRAGWRGTHEDDYNGNVMRTMAIALEDDADLAAAAAWFAAMPVQETPDTVTGDAEHGRQLFTTCVACHGEQAEGNPGMQAPALADQSDWYLVTQLQHYRDGVRGAVPGDVYGAQMRAMAATLTTDDDILDLVAYINTLD